MKKTAISLAVTTLAVGATFASTVPAGADLTTRCVGEGGAVVVPGDLIVPKGSSCTLTGTTVTGNIRVAPGADLVARDVTVSGTVTVLDSAYLDMTTSKVNGRVVLNGSFGGFLESTEVDGGLLNKSRAGTDGGGFLYVVSSDISADVVARTGELLLDNSEVTGSVTSQGSVFTDLYGTFVDGRLTVESSTDGSIVCGSVIHQTANFLNNGTLVQLGSDGPVRACANGSSYWGQDVVVEATTGELYVDRNLVNGNLTLLNNEPVARVGPSNRVRGDVIGEYEAWDGSGSMERSRQSSVDPERSENVRALGTERSQQAVDRAALAGDAEL